MPATIGEPELRRGDSEASDESHAIIICRVQPLLALLLTAPMRKSRGRALHINDIGYVLGCGRRPPCGLLANPPHEKQAQAWHVRNNGQRDEKHGEKRESRQIKTDDGFLEAVTRDEKVQPDRGGAIADL